MRRHPRQSRLSGVLHDHVPHHALAECCGGVLPILTLPHTAEQRAGMNTRGGRPLADGKFDKRRNRHDTNALSLPQHFAENPAAITLLHGFEMQGDKFAAAQPTSQQHRQNRAVPLAVRRAGLRQRKQFARLFPGKPVPRPGTGLPDAFEGKDSLGDIAVQEVVLGRFRGELADGRQADIYRCRR